MTKSEFDAIRDRRDCWAKPGSPGEADVVMVCSIGGKIIHPDELGADASLDFKRRCEAVAAAVRDRTALLKFIEEGFDIDWLPKDGQPPQPKETT